MMTHSFGYGLHAAASERSQLYSWVSWRSQLHSSCRDVQHLQRLGLGAQKTQASPQAAAEVQNISAGCIAAAQLLQAVQSTKTIIFKDFLLHIWNHCLLFTCLHRHLQFCIMKEE